MRHLRRVTLAPAQAEDPDEEAARFRDLFVLRLIIALAAVLKGSSPF